MGRSTGGASGVGGGEQWILSDMGSEVLSAGGLSNSNLSS